MVTAFKNLRSDNDFFDTTLGCYDSRGRVLKAHKVILSACSPFFRNILKMSTGYPHPNPFIYLRGVSYNDLQCLLDFMYHGEVKVAQEDLNSFLAIAEELQIKGLTNKSGGGGSSGGGEETTAKKPICTETADSEEPPMKKEKWDGNTGEFVSDNTQTQTEGGGDFAMDNGQEAGQGQDDGNEGSMLDQVMSAGTGDEHQGSTGTGGGETSGGEEGQIEKVIRIYREGPGLAAVTCLVIGVARWIHVSLHVFRRCMSRPIHRKPFSLSRLSTHRSMTIVNLSPAFWIARSA